MTIVAVDDCMTAVIKTPKRNAFIGLLVTFSRIRFSVPEELSFIPPLISRIPYRNIARPPSRDITSKTLIICSDENGLCTGSNTGEWL